MNDDWTWSGAGEEALYGIISVFVILILLTLLTWVAGKVFLGSRRATTQTMGENHTRSLSETIFLPSTKINLWSFGECSLRGEGGCE